MLSNHLHMHHIRKRKQVAKIDSKLLSLGSSPELMAAASGTSSIRPLVATVSDIR